MCLRISVAVSSPVYFLIKVPRKKFFSHFAIILSNCRICEDHVSVNCLHRRPLRRFVLRDSSFKDLVVLKSPDHYNIVSTILLKSCPLNSWPSFLPEAVIIHLHKITAKFVTECFVQGAKPSNFSSGKISPPSFPPRILEVSVLNSLQLRDKITQQKAKGRNVVP